MDEPVKPYNFKLGEYVEESPDLDPRELIPQLPAALEAYDIYIKIGATPNQAATIVNAICAGENRKDYEELFGIFL